MIKPKIKIVPAVLILLFFIFMQAVVFAVPALAQNKCTGAISDVGLGQLYFCPNVSIGGTFVKGGDAIPVDTQTLGNYIKTWYGFIIGTVGILASVMIMYGGFRWLTSRGGQAVSEAKDIIFSALIGLTLAFLSYTILYLINPGLLQIGLQPMQGMQYNANYDAAGINVKFEGLANSGGGGSPNTNGTQQEAQASMTNMEDGFRTKGVNVPIPNSVVRNCAPGEVDMHCLGRGWDYPTSQSRSGRGNPQFDAEMQKIYDAGRNAGYEFDGHPVRYVTLPDGTPGRMINEGNHWHVDNGKPGEILPGRTKPI